MWGYRGGQGFGVPYSVRSSSEYRGQGPSSLIRQALPVLANSLSPWPSWNMISWVPDIDHSGTSHQDLSLSRCLVVFAAIPSLQCPPFLFPVLQV